MASDPLLDQLIALSHSLGDPARDWAMLGEGNTSTRRTDETFYVKASGSQLGTLTLEQVAEVRFAPILDALASGRSISDSETKDLLLSSCVGTTPKMPSVETLMHAYLLTLPDVNFIGHTHVTTVNSLMCSKAGWEAVRSGGRLFPDEIVVCGVAPCCVPYVDPGVVLASEIKSRVEAYIKEYGENPRTIYMQNHGFIALGKSPKQVLDITMMADKAARILLGAFAAGGPVFLTPAHVDRIHTRPDEHYRRAAIAAQTGH
jgi:rhamnose utilization protein RhaD (predicted bifunctional aldolase and dehydrogenase)